MVFDPYHAWLGIPPKEQPPDHYRILGLVRFESDPDVISSAADRQMAHVRQAGRQHEREQAAMLNRLSTARVCLLDPAARDRYDRTLRARSRIEQADREALISPRPPMPGPTRLDSGKPPVVRSGLPALPPPLPEFGGICVPRPAPHIPTDGRPAVNRDSMAIASAIGGFIGLASIPLLLPFVGILAAVGAIGLGIFGLKSEGRRWAIVGIVCGCLTLLIVVASVALFAQQLEDYEYDFENRSQAALAQGRASWSN